MLDYIELQHVGPARAMRVDFARRLTLLTGDNGVGKTFALDLAWWALTRTWAGAPALPHRGPGVKPRITYRVQGKSGTTNPVRSSYHFKEQRWRLPGRRPPMPGLILYIRVDGSYSVWDPARNYWRQPRGLGVVSPDRPAAYHFDRRDIWNGLQQGERVICNGLLRDWVSWQRQGSEAFEALCAALARLSPSEAFALRPGAPTRVSLDEARDIPTLALPYGEVPVTHVSAGMRRVLGLAYLLVWARAEHRAACALLNQTPDHRLVILFDEVETHLHPRWQRRILPALLAAAQGMGEDLALQCVASTHAPLVALSLEPRFDPARDRLLGFELETGEVVVAEQAWSKRGDASSWLTSEVFELPTAYAVEAEQAIAQAADLMQRLLTRERPLGTDERAQVKQAHQALLDNLSEFDPYWRRWQYFLDTRLDDRDRRADPRAREESAGSRAHEDSDR